MAEQTYYEQLGLQPDAGDDEIQEAYHNLMNRYKSAAETDKSGQGWLANNKAINDLDEAYSTLSDSVAREEYDDTHRGSSNPNTQTQPETAPQETVGVVVHQPQQTEQISPVDMAQRLRGPDQWEGKRNEARMKQEKIVTDMDKINQLAGDISASRQTRYAPRV